MAVQTYRPVALNTSQQEPPVLHVIGHAVPQRQSHPQVVEITPYTLEPLVRAQQQEISHQYQLVGALRNEIEVLTMTMRESQHQSHVRERDLIRVIHRYVLREQG